MLTSTTVFQEYLNFFQSDFFNLKDFTLAPAKNTLTMAIFLSRIPFLGLESNQIHRNMFHICSIASRKWTQFQDNSEVLLYSDNKNHQDQKLTFGTLKTIARKEKDDKGKNLVLVTVKVDSMKGVQKTLPTFKLVNDQALEVLLRKSRSNVTDESFAIVDIDDPENIPKRVKQKTFVITCDLQPNVMEATLKKIRTELNKSNFVAIKIKRGGQDESELQDFQSKFVNDCLEGELESMKSHLTCKIV